MASVRIGNFAHGLVRDSGSSPESAQFSRQGAKSWSLRLCVRILQGTFATPRVGGYRTTEIGPS